MPSYPIVDIEWLTNSIIARVYPFIDMAGLSCICLILTLLALVVQFPQKDKVYALLPAVFTAGVLFFFFGVRTQVVSWLFFSLLIKILSDNVAWQRLRYGVPFLFLIWANMHGSFLLGLIVLLFMLTGRFFARKGDSGDILVVIAAILVTFVNPYGLRLWQEIWVQTTDPNIHFRYGEWMPLFLLFDWFLTIAVIVWSGLIFVYRKRFPATQVGLLLLLFLAANSSIRHVPFFFIAALPLVTKCLVFLRDEAKENKIKLQYFNTGYICVLILVLIAASSYMLRIYSLTESITEQNSYPVRALAYLRAHKAPGNLESVFQWGGYLDWQLPEKKVFLDGRMNNWRLPNPPPHESASIYHESEMLARGYVSFQKEAEKYNIDTILFPTISAKEANQYAQSTLIFAPFLAKKKPPFRPLRIQWQEAGWHVVYQDSIATIYRKRGIDR